LLFLTWLLLVAWLFSAHVFWRDEVRAYSLALSGRNAGEMLRNIQGEGHPATWYLLLRGAHEIFGTREVLPVAALLISLAAMGVFAFAAPFRTPIIGLVLFSLFGAFDYPIVARNYGIAALVMFVLAALYPRIKQTPWFGLGLALLANTNVPSAILAAAFLAYRFVEILTSPDQPTARDWFVAGLNALLALVGAISCFLLVYPPLNDGAVSQNYGHIGIKAVADALGDGGKGFSNLVLNAHGWIPPILLWASCFAFIRRPAALVSSLCALTSLKLFFFFVYPSGYRHEALFVVFLLGLFWIEATNGQVGFGARRWKPTMEAVGTAAFLLLVGAQTLDLAKPLYLQAKGVPYSQSADVAKVLKRPDLRNAIVMADPDLMLEPLPYYVGNPLWFLREQSFGKVFLKTRSGRQQISLDDILADADALHGKWGRPVVILLKIDLFRNPAGIHPALYRDTTVVTAAGVRHFLGSTRLVARLRPAITDEAYDLYIYKG
jgi:hypothetical protein